MSSGLDVVQVSRERVGSWKTLVKASAARTFEVWTCFRLSSAGTVACSHLWLQTPTEYSTILAFVLMPRRPWYKMPNLPRSPNLQGWHEGLLTVPHPWRIESNPSNPFCLRYAWLCLSNKHDKATCVSCVYGWRRATGRAWSRCNLRAIGAIRACAWRLECAIGAIPIATRAAHGCSRSHRGRSHRDSRSHRGRRCHGSCWSWSCWLNLAEVRLFQLVPVHHILTNWKNKFNLQNLRYRYIRQTFMILPAAHCSLLRLLRRPPPGWEIIQSEVALMLKCSIPPDPRYHWC